MQTPGSTFIYRHTRLGILTEHATDVVDLTDGLDSLLAETAMTTGLLNLRSFGPGTGILVAAALPASADLGGVTTVALPIVDGRLCLGIRERVLLVDLHGPGAREIAVVIVGEGPR